MAIRARIEFDSENDIYYSGDRLTGTLYYEVDSPLFVQSIFVKFIGVADVAWIDSEAQRGLGGSKSYKLGYKAHEEYFNYVYEICTQKCAEPFMINPGETPAYKFHYQMPFLLPSSFEGTYGRVWYRAIGYLEPPNGEKYLESVIQKRFYVVSPLDLSLDREAVKKLSMELESMYSCCCKSRPVAITVKAPSIGYCPGQTIPLEVLVSNRSKFEVKSLTVSLVKREVYHCYDPKAQYALPEEVISEMKKCGITRNTRRKFRIELLVPDMIAPNLRYCGIIDVDYLLKVSYDMSGCNRGDFAETEIIIGLLPLSRSSTVDYIHPMIDRLPKSPVPNSNLALMNSPRMFGFEQVPGCVGYRIGLVMQGGGPSAPLL